MTPAAPVRFSNITGTPSSDLNASLLTPHRPMRPDGKPIRLVSGAAPGSATDIVGRAVGTH
jgi:tripartite-type tricarboxylate transporter receptor subunit TctC